MKVELKHFEDRSSFYNQEIKILTFSFWKRDVKSKADRELIADFVRHLYHTNCIDSNYSEEHVEDLLKETKHARIGILIENDQEDNKSRLCIYNANQKSQNK